VRALPDLPAASPRALPAPWLSASRRLERLGVAASSDLDLLTILLARADPAAAARVLEASDDLIGLADPDVAELRRAAGLGRGAAIGLVAAVELGRRVASRWPQTSWRVRTPADLAERLMPVMAQLPVEELRVVLLNTKNVVTACTTVYRGNLAGAPVRVGEMYRHAIRRQAAAIMVVHNHPSGDPTPSAEDLRITGELARAGRLLDVGLLDHLVLGHGRWVSLRAIGAVD